MNIQDSFSDLIGGIDIPPNSVKIEEKYKLIPIDYNIHTHNLDYIKEKARSIYMKDNSNEEIIAKIKKELCTNIKETNVFKP